MDLIGLGMNIVVVDENNYQQVLAMVENFAEENELDYILFNDETLELWCLRWLENGWRDSDGKDMNQGVIYRRGGEKRLLPRWASMLLGYEAAFRCRAGS